MPNQPRQDGGKPPEPRPPAQGKSRPGQQSPQQQHQRPPEPRRKRGEPRRVAWADGVDRAWCTRALTFLPESFPVESHAGAATIPPTVVDRREQMVLLCDFSHGGDHAWPAISVLIEAGESAPDAEREQS
ncbi:MAG: hypothetical protein KC442_01910 [Thermomicrobiales bacterium]|nr:hypothetical protein [Thermomicrobiales bacterium]